jgi:hypothetical protein
MLLCAKVVLPQWHALQRDSDYESNRWALYSLSGDRRRNAIRGMRTLHSPPITPLRCCVAH